MLQSCAARCTANCAVAHSRVAVQRICQASFGSAESAPQIWKIVVLRKSQAAARYGAMSDDVANASVEPAAPPDEGPDGQSADQAAGVQLRQSDVEADSHSWSTSWMFRSLVLLHGACDAWILASMHSLLHGSSRSC